MKPIKTLDPCADGRGYLYEAWCNRKRSDWMRRSVNREILWFSHGAASACALKLASEKYQSVIPVYCDVSRDEHEDNTRFRKEVEAWTGVTVQFIRSRDFMTVDEVIEAKRYLAGIAGAPCTVELKKIPRFHFQLPDDVHMFGFTADETDRIEQFEKHNPELFLEWILRDNGITKADCFKMLAKARIELPIRYKQGFKNNNCKGCVKATSLEYWVLTRRHDPEVFERRCLQSRKYGARLTRLNGERIFLDEIPPDSELDARFKDGSAQENISCGPECGGGIL